MRSLARIMQCAPMARIQWRRVPPRKLSIGLVADERLGRVPSLATKGSVGPLHYATFNADSTSTYRPAERMPIRQPLLEHLLNAEEVLTLLNREIERVGNQSEWARRNGVPRASLNLILHRRKRPAGRTIAALGLELIVVPPQSELLHLLRKEIERVGSQAQFARLAGINRPHVNNVLKGRRTPGPEILKALKLARVVGYAPRSRRR